MKTLLKGLIVIIAAIVIFLIGYSAGYLKGDTNRYSEKVASLEKLLKAQRTESAQISTTIEYMKTQWAGETVSARRHLLSIWLPSILVILNIFLTISCKIWDDSKLEIS